MAQAQTSGITLSGLVRARQNKRVLPYVHVMLSTPKDSAFVAGTVTDEQGRFILRDIIPADYKLSVSFMGYRSHSQVIQVGRLSAFLDLGTTELQEDVQALQEVVVTGTQDVISEGLDKKTFNLEENSSQAGGSALQAMQNLPGITITQEGQVQLRGSARVTVLIDGKQTALTGFGNQAGLDNIPASAVEKIEIINNPSARYDANGMAGIINIVLKKEKKEGLNGKVGFIAGLGALGEKRVNLPTIRSQYAYTPKLNPTASFNYRRKKINLFLQGDILHQKRLNKNEFTDRVYENGDQITQQYQENRTQTAITVKSGVDWLPDDQNSFTVSGLYGREGHIDRGDLPYFNAQTEERNQLWQFYEDEVNSTITVSGAYGHTFKQPGHRLEAGFNYSFLREDEKYFITNTLPAVLGQDSFKLIADQYVTDVNVDYVRPLKHGRIETGAKFRWRNIPTNMQFFPGTNSPMDIDADGKAVYNEVIPALYGNYVYESKRVEVEAGLRVEYVKVNYEVEPNHNTYRSDGYQYTQPFPNLRLAYLINDKNRISLFYNRRVDRPDEGDLRIFPKYDDPQILKVGNPALRPQFTRTLEVGYKTNWEKGYFYSAGYHRRLSGVITRIVTAIPGGTTLYSLMQNADRGYNTGLELVLNQEVTQWFSFNVNLNIYENVLEGFSVENQYPAPVIYQGERLQNYTGNLKFNGNVHLPDQLDLQLTGIYLAPDIVPQGEIAARYSVDVGLKKALQKGRGELFFNASDLFNTMRIKRDIRTSGVHLRSTDLYETQIIRIGYSYKF